MGVGWVESGGVGAHRSERALILLCICTCIRRKKVTDGALACGTPYVGWLGGVKGTVYGWAWLGLWAGRVRGMGGQCKGNVWWAQSKAEDGALAFSASALADGAEVKGQRWGQ